MSRIWSIKLDAEIEQEVKNFIDEKFECTELRQEFPNLLLRKDVLDLLDKYCTVIYYPFEGESNNGCRVKDIPFLDGTTRDFVFINTAQTDEKQVFTAAHELGHIWGVDKYIIDRHPQIATEEGREKIVNKFAAILLMPADLFHNAIKRKAEGYIEKDGEITLINFVKLTVYLMKFFYAPWKAVVLRMAELNRLDRRLAEKLCEDYEAGKEIRTVTEKYIDECGYVNLKNAYKVKLIEGLAEMLDDAEATGAVPQNLIESFRQEFDLEKPTEISTKMDESFLLDT